MYELVADSDRPIPEDVVFTGLIGKTVKALDPWHEADPIAVHMSLMAMASVLLEGGVKVYTGSKWEYPLLNVLLFGESAKGRKGTSGTIAFEVVTKAFPGWRDDHTGGAPSSGAGIVKLLANTAVETNWLRPLDEIPEQLREEAATKPIRRIKPGLPYLFYEEEIAKVLHRARMDDSYEALIRVMWQGANLTGRYTSHLQVTIPRPVVGWLAHVTPGEFVAKLGRSSLHGGTFNRFMLFWVQRNRIIRRIRPIPEDLLARLASEFRARILFGRTVGKIQPTEEAWDFWENDLHPEIDGQLSASPLWGEFVGRALDNIMRMAAIYAVMDKRRAITADDLKAARGVMRYVFASLPTIMRELGDNTPVMDPASHRPGDPTKAHPALVEQIKAYLMTRGRVDQSTLTRAMANRKNPTTGQRWTAEDIRNAVAAHNGNVYVETVTDDGRGPGQQQL